MGGGRRGQGGRGKGRKDGGRGQGGGRGQPGKDGGAGRGEGRKDGSQMGVRPGASGRQGRNGGVLHAILCTDEMALDQPKSNLSTHQAGTMTDKRFICQCTGIM